MSAFRGNNVKVGALGEFLKAIRVGRVLTGSVLIIENIDRLSRNKVGEALQMFISILNSGVSIVTREPRRTYTQASINDIATLLEPIIYMARAHEGSATKYSLKLTPTPDPAVAELAFALVWRFDFDAPGFCLLDADPGMDSHALYGWQC